MKKLTKEKNTIDVAVENREVQQEKEEKENNETQKQGTTEESTHIDNNIRKPPTYISQNKGNKAQDKLEIMQGHGRQMEDKTITEWLVERTQNKKKHKKKNSEKKMPKKKSKVLFKPVELQGINVNNKIATSTSKTNQSQTPILEDKNYTSEDPHDKAS
ncbi:uncharacterized protein [Nicotiana tomentosiformis]|uniref:uncharacterized protein n=1 Tax=Nicotiana tomentosiformis TaxID=4098 RepID=UPI00388C3EFA